ncbi:WSSV480 [White spot syndrome virus]|uniref:WSSV480 n=1 Tax=White spot syndrome virus TaxID=342409 RepID=A0A2I6SCE5_9VIRU|nr:WSSV480 [White spot syndrome virus]
MLSRNKETLKMVARSSKTKSAVEARRGPPLLDASPSGGAHQ